MTFDIPYLRHLEDLRLLPFAADGVRLLRERGFLIVVATNQSAVGRGFLDHQTLASIHKKMSVELESHGATLDAIYVCPHHPDEGCQCRKPRPGMLLDASKDLEIDLSRSFMVGNNESDIAAGKVARCRTILIVDGSSDPHKKHETSKVLADFRARDLLEAARWITGLDDSSI